MEHAWYDYALAFLGGVIFLYVAFRVGSAAIYRSKMDYERGLQDGTKRTPGPRGRP